MNKVIFINWFQTLSNQPIWHHLDTPNNHLYSILKTRVLETPLKDEWFKGQVSFCNIWHHLNQYGIPKEIVQTQTMHWLSTITLNQDLLSSIQQVRQKGYRVIIATNHVDIFGCYVYPYLHLENYFDGYISSAETGFLKTQQNTTGVYPFFDSYLKQNQLTYQDCLLIDSSKEVTNIYQRLGMTTVTPSDTQGIINILQKL